MTQREPDPPRDPSGEPPEAGTSSKKERVLHTRVPAVLEQELKRFAESMRVPVSNLVRTILEDAVSVADRASSNVESGLESAAHHLRAERERLKLRVQKGALDEVFAYQQVTLAQATECARCQASLAPGARAHLGLTDRPGAPRMFVCDACLPRT